MSKAITMSGGKTIPLLPYEPTFRFDATEGYGINCLSGTYPDCTNIACHLCCNQRPDSYNSCPACYSSFRNIGNTTQTFCGQNGVGTLTSTNNHRMWSNCYVNPTIECQFSNAYGGMYQAWNSYKDAGNTHQNCCNPNLVYIHGGYWCYGAPRYSLIMGFQIQCYCSTRNYPTVIEVPNINYSGHRVQGCYCSSSGCVAKYPIVLAGSIPGVEFETGCRYILGVRYEPDNCCILCNYSRYSGNPHACCNSGYYIALLRDDGKAGYNFCHYAEHCPYQCATSSTTQDCMASIGVGGTYLCGYTSSGSYLWMNVGNFAYWENCALTPAELNKAMDAYRPKYNITTCHEWSENPMSFTMIRWEGTNTTSGTSCQSNSIYEFYMFCNGMVELRVGQWACKYGLFGQYMAGGCGTNFGSITPNTSYVWDSYQPITTLYTGYTYLNGQIVQENRLPMAGSCSHWYASNNPYINQRGFPDQSYCPQLVCGETTSYFSYSLITSTDDAYVDIYMPHLFCALYGNYSSSSCISVSTNGVISFGGGCSAYSGFSSTYPALDKIFIDAGDRSAQYIGQISSKK